MVFSVMMIHVIESRSECKNTSDINVTCLVGCINCQITFIYTHLVKALFCNAHSDMKHLAQLSKYIEYLQS